MYGVTDRIDLSKFVGTTLEQIAIGRYQIIFRFHPDGSIDSEGKWLLLGPDGSVVDQSEEPGERDAYRVHVCLGQRVATATPEPPDAIAITFETGYVLRFVDDSEHYESFNIQPGGVIV
jgi:hypothetical protein